MNKNNMLNTCIEDLCLTVRTENTLKRYGIYTLYELKNLSEKELKRFKGIGVKGRQEILSHWALSNTTTKGELK